MGFDDTVADSGIINVIEKKIEVFAYYYNEIDDLTEENLEKWEKTRCYNGYSLSYHVLYPLYANTCCDGVIVGDMTDEQKARLTLLVRSKIVAIIEKYYESN